MSVQSMETLKKMVCLLSCQPRNMKVQLPAVLSCVRSAIGAKAAGVYWREGSGKWTSCVQRPARFRLDSATRQAIQEIQEPARPQWGHKGLSWLAVPMKAGGVPVGRLWVVDELGREFSREELEFLTMAGNQLALAQDNSRLIEEIRHVAGQRGELIRRMVLSQDERCRRISRELHDEVSQSLTAAALDLEALELTREAWGPDLIERLGALRVLLVKTLEEVGRIIMDLRPSVLEDMGLVAALGWYGGKRLESAGARLHVKANGVGERLAPHVETTLYRIGQEALTNVAKHGMARNVWLSVTLSRRHVSLSVRDDGCGFDAESVLTHPDHRVGIGLFGMRERAALLGGRIEVCSAPGKGTRIKVQIPRGPETEGEADSGLHS